MKRTGRVYPQVSVDSSPCRAVGQAVGVLLTRTVDVTGLGGGLSAGLARWRRPFAVHDPGKIIADLALSLASGGDCLADIGLLRSEPGVYGRGRFRPDGLSAGSPGTLRWRCGRSTLPVPRPG